MTEHREDRPQDRDARDLTVEEEKFFGADHDHEGEPERGVGEGDTGREHAAREAGAAGAAAPPAPSRGSAERELEGRRRAGSEMAAARQAEGERPAGTRESADRPTGSLFRPEEAESLRSRWDGIQTQFVDEPRSAVEKADALVGDVMQRLADGFSSERARLEREWDRGEGVSTEDLRVALKRYRSFFDRLLSV